ncbi:MAG: DEAD/DEAH box helicase [Fusobacteria bacterium]|nr:DEAD/DEAH box helicase [Fusobacteriota bacterium]
MNIVDYILPEVTDKILAYIKEVNGNETFLRGLLDTLGRVQDVELLANGNEYSVPAIISNLRAGEVVIHNHPSGNLTPSMPDIALSSFVGNMGCGSYIIDNTVENIYVIVPIKKSVPPQDVEDFFGINSKILENFPNFEPRAEQLAMAKIVQECLNENSKCIIEAGTGTGKTLAYLIPSLSYALQNKKKVVISTNTINLQEQLLHKDVPLAKKILGKNFKYELVKGRANYLCFRRFYNLTPGEIESFTLEQKNQFSEIRTWAITTVKGDKQELSFIPDYSVWENIQCEPDLCNGTKCGYFERCFFQNARKEILTADLLIVNHHLFFADLSIRKETGFLTDYAILPNYEVLIIDEAHNVEKTARDYFGTEISKYSMQKMLGKIYPLHKSKSSFSLILKINEMLAQKNIQLFKKFSEHFDSEVYPKHLVLFEHSQNLFSVENIPVEILGNKVRLTAEILSNEKLYTLFHTLLPNFQKSFKNYYKSLQELLVIVKDEDANLTDSTGIIFDFERFVSRLSEIQDACRQFNKLENPDMVFWIESSEKYSNVKLGATPIHVGKVLSEHLFEPLNKIVFTSATLAVNGSFDFFKSRIGITKVGHESIIASPFDYKQNRRIIVSKILPEPQAREFNTEIAKVIPHVLELTNGNAFILFTSYSGMNQVYYRLKEVLEKEYTLFIQGEMPRHQLIEQYKVAYRPVLFATDSFWEGIDVQGEKLSSVILVKLPFTVPSDPVTEAIIETMQKSGQNPFMEFQVPEAVIKFKQGIGRLIRSKEDSGYITVLDKRILTKHYGKQFLNALSPSLIMKTNFFSQGENNGQK